LAYYNGPLRRQIRQAGVVMTVSQTSENAIREWLRDDAVQIVNAGNGCADIFTPEGPVASDGQPYILYVGNLRKHKNVDVLFRAAARSRHVRLVIVVPALDHDLASKRRHELNLDHMVDIIHQVSDNRLACLYRGAAALAMPSTLEGFGLPALESIQCGTPVIYWSGCQAVAEIVGNCGWALDTATDSDSWAGAMEKAVRQALTVEPSLGNYNWQHVALMVSEALATVVG
jgi:glycosyltransferase involved in cell wall biosynthesis